MVLSIFLVVGVDVGFNSNSGQFLMKQFGIESDCSRIRKKRLFLRTYARYICRCTSAYQDFIKKILHVDIHSRHNYTDYYVACVFSCQWPGVLVFMTGLAVANIFPLVFSIAVETYPSRSNEISGLNDDGNLRRCCYSVNHRMDQRYQQCCNRNVSTYCMYDIPAGSFHLQP